MNYSHYAPGGYAQPPTNAAYYGQHATGQPPSRDAPYGGPPPLYDAPPPQQFDAPPPARTVDSWRGDSGSRNRSRSPDRYGGRRSRSGSPRRSGSPGYHRGRRSRSRSRSPYYSRSSRRSRSGSRHRSRSRDRETSWRRSRSPRRRSRSPYRRRSPPAYEMQPSAKIMVTSLPQYADRDTLNILLARQGFHPVDIRVVRRNTDAGGQRVFGFIEFSDPAQSQQWMNYNDGYLRFEDGFSAKLEYSREDSTSYAERRSAGLGAPPNPASDWTCAKCTINNFNRRNSCFKCGTTREDSEALEAKGYGMVGVTPCDTLLIRELPVGVTEESVRASLARYTNVPILRLQISPSRRYTLIQLRSVEDASYLLSTFNKVVPYIDNCAVIVTFARLSLNQIVVAENVNALKSQVGLSSAHMHEDPTNSAAQLAHNAIQIAQMGRQMASGGLQESVQNISTPVGVFPIYPAPSRSGFQFEPSSGYYYDSSTGFYFDAKTEYYFNTQTNQWMFWCAKYSTYIPCEGGDLEMKKRLQEVDKAPGGLGASSSAIGAAPVAASGNEAVADVLRACVEQNKMLVEALAKAQSGRGDPHLVRSLTNQVDQMGRMVGTLSGSSGHKRHSEPFGGPMDTPPWKKPLMNALAGPYNYGQSRQPPLNNLAFASPGSSRQLREIPPANAAGPYRQGSTFMARNDQERPLTAKQLKQLRRNEQQQQKSQLVTPMRPAIAPKKPTGPAKPTGGPNPVPITALPPPPTMCRKCGNSDHMSAICQNPNKPSAQVMAQLQAVYELRKQEWHDLKKKLEAEGTMPLVDADGKKNVKNVKLFERQFPRVVHPKDAFFRAVMEAYPDGVVLPRHFTKYCGKCAKMGHGKNACKNPETHSKDFMRRFHQSCAQIQSFLKRFVNKDGEVRISKFYNDIRAFDALEGDNLLYRRLREDNTWFQQGMVFQTKLARLCGRCGHFGHKTKDCQAPEIDPTEMKRLRALVRAVRLKHGPQLKKGMKISTFDKHAINPAVDFPLLSWGEREAEDGDQSDAHSVILLDDDDENKTKRAQPENYDTVSEPDKDKDNETIVNEVLEKMLETLGFGHPEQEDVIVLDAEEDLPSQEANGNVPAEVDMGRTESVSPTGALPENAEPAKEAPAVNGNIKAAVEPEQEDIVILSQSSKQPAQPSTNVTGDEGTEVPSMDALVEREEIEELMPEDDDEKPADSADADTKSAQLAGVHDSINAVEKKDKKKKEEEESSKPKTAHQIQKEMEKWAKRQEKIKMTFKQPESKAQPANFGAGGSVKADVGKVDEAAQKPWADNDDDEQELPPPPDAVLPGRMRNVGVALNATSSRTSTSSSHGSRSENAVSPQIEPASILLGTPVACLPARMSTGDAAAALATATAAAEEQFDEEHYVDRAKNACMLCRRQFPSTEVLQKHISMSDLHKTNLAAKRKEFVTSSVAASTAVSHSGGNKPYRDRAKERRAVYGLDPTGLSNEPGDDQADPAEAERIAAMKASVPLDESNVGNRLLKSMGWSEGRGLGKDLQGIVNPIAAEQRVQGVGLGATGSKLAPSLSRRERGRQATLARYNELQD